METFTNNDNNVYLIVEKNHDFMAAFTTLQAALDYITQSHMSIFDLNLMAVGQNGTMPTIDGKYGYYIIDKEIDPVAVMYLDKLDGYPYFMAGDAFHYHKGHTSDFDKCWGWILADSLEDVQSFFNACMEN
jgi:hypothetical protein